MGRKEEVVQKVREYINSKRIRPSNNREWDWFIPNTELEAMRAAEELLKFGGEDYLTHNGKLYKFTVQP